MDLREFDDFNVDVIRDREELLFLLSEGAAFEHTVMLGYIYAMSTMKRSVDEGVSEQELAAIDRWRGKIRSVALEEMVHLTLVNNLLAALGASPNFGRPDFPVPPGHFPAHVILALAPFNQATIQHFAYLERPTDAVIEDGEGYHSDSKVVREIRTDLLSPTKSDYPSQGLRSVRRTAFSFAGCDESDRLGLGAAGHRCHRGAGRRRRVLRRGIALRQVLQYCRGIPAIEDGSPGLRAWASGSVQPATD